MYKTIMMALLFFLGACETAPKENINDVTPQENEKPSRSSLTLNNGEKWMINEEMKPPIMEGKELLLEFIATKDTGFIALSEKLATCNTKLIKSCSMTGKAHDELHKWLIPHINLIDSLGKAKGQYQAEKLIDEISTSFNTFNTYFK